ncbi:PKD domain-containing protein, partial [Planctomycetota bacterium]
MRSNRSSRVQLIWAVTLLGTLACLPGSHAFGQDASAPGQGATDDQDTWCDEILEAPIYILVIDHSGSMFQNEDMTNAAGAAVNRWEYMRHLAADFLRQAPIGTTVYLYVFEAYEDFGEAESRLAVLEKEFTLDSEEERTAEAEYVLSPEIEEDIPDADPNVAGTALFDTLARAFERAEFECDRQPGAYVRVMAYTDITAYSDRKEEQSREYDQAKLKQKFARLVDDKESVYLFFIPMGEEQDGPFKHDHVWVGSPKHPIPIYVRPNRVLLRHPREVWDQEERTEQELTVDLCLSREHEALLGDKPASLKFESENVEAEAVGEVYLERGRSRIRLKVTNASELSVDRKYGGRLKLLLPEVAGHEIHLTPPNGVEIEFEPPGPVPLRVAYPQIEGGRPAVFPLDMKIPFRVEVPQTATVHWRFPEEWKLPAGAERTEPGADPRVPYVTEREGDFEVVITASAPGFQDAAPVRVPIKILDIGVNIKQAPPWIVAGHSATLECVGHGPVQRYEWLIQGKTWPGQGSGLTIDHQFLWPGIHTVNVRAIHATHGIFPCREPLPVMVIPEQQLRLVSPTRGIPYRYALKSDGEMRFEAEATGGLVQSVVFELTASATDDSKRDQQESESGKAAATPKKVVHWSLTSDPVPVRAVGDRMVAEFAHPFNETDTLDAPVTVSAKAVMQEGCPSEFTAPPDAMTLQEPRFKPDVVWPPDEQYGLGQDVPFRVECDSHNFSATWDFGDGSPKKEGAAVSHRYEHHHPNDYAVTLEVERLTPVRSTTESHLMVLLRRPPVAELEFLDADGKPTLEFAVDEPIQVKAGFAGDAGTRVWEVDGKPRSLDKPSLSYDEPGKHAVLLKVWWKEEGRDGVGEPADVVEVVIRICRNNIWLFLGVLILALALFAVIYRFCTRNQPLGWSIGVSHRKDRFGPLRTDVKGHWSRRTKKANIPLSAIMRDIAGPMKSNYWTAGAGSRTYLIVTPLKRGKSIRGALNFSDKGNSNVTFGSVDDAPEKRIYELLDARAPDDDSLRHVFFELH